MRHKNNPSYTAVGASGAISAVLAGAAISNPTLPIGHPLLPEFAVPGVVFVFGYLFISLYLGYRGSGRVAHLAHAAGTIYGVAVVAIIGIT
jgi:membrane associated rhomboid family serine protease